MEEMNRSDAPCARLKKLEGAIAKKQRRRNISASIRSAAEPVAVRKAKIQPRIIHAVNPPLIHAEPSTFMRIVQTLTGCPVTRLGCEDEELEELATLSAAAITGAESPMSSFVGAALPVGSPCSSMSSASTIITSATDHSITSTDEESLDANAGPGRKIFGENVEFFECRDAQEAMASPSMSSCSLLWHSENSYVFLGNSGLTASASSARSHSVEECGCYAESSDNAVLLPSEYHHHLRAQDLESTLDSYLEHLLSSYDSDAYGRFTSTSAVLADVCDPMLLKELL
ncbi:hypothetical protein L7F22_006985 [Adiantum nelumboides]|nr:hypothetical protein [Adiantum nelumboides]